MTKFLLYGGRAAGKVIYIPESHVGQPWVVPIYHEPNLAVYPDDMAPTATRHSDELYYPTRLNMFDDKIMLYVAADFMADGPQFNQFQRDAILNILGGMRL
jgi:hypothetical protein